MLMQSFDADVVLMLQTYSLSCASSSSQMLSGKQKAFFSRVTE